jgi:hypothetical protein
MWTPDAALSLEEQDKTGKVYMRLGKSRHGGKGALIDYQFGPLSLVMVPVGEPENAMRARQELSWKYRFRDDWERAVYRHRTGYDRHIENLPALDMPLPEQGALTL